MRQMGSGGHRLGPATAQPADFGTISSSLEQSLTLPETTPPPQEGKYGPTPQQVLTMAGEGAGGRDGGGPPQYSQDRMLRRQERAPGRA